ncbi:hypothetical protein CDAR_450511 [Caerostris darwini]|uniref:Uncharacterized protein n=1 Tax=Caerostris darwini TaxID=1538125 RepID=A0AAV4WNZ8_9ARAC|nr:hypothetical protein CDAR_450511 [Caerostris darwini]
MVGIPKSSDGIAQNLLPEWTEDTLAFNKRYETEFDENDSLLHELSSDSAFYELEEEEKLMFNNLELIEECLLQNCIDKEEGFFKEQKIMEQSLSQKYAKREKTFNEPELKPQFKNFSIDAEPPQNDRWKRKQFIPQEKNGDINASHISLLPTTSIETTVPKEFKNTAEDVEFSNCSNVNLDSSELDNLSKNINKIQGHGVNPFQIGVLINKSDFLEHCNLVKSGVFAKTKFKAPIFHQKPKVEILEKEVEVDRNVNTETVADQTNCADKENDLTANSKTKIELNTTKTSLDENATDVMKNEYFSKTDQENNLNVESFTAKISELIQSFESKSGQDSHNKKSNFFIARDVKQRQSLKLTRNSAYNKGSGDDAGKSGKPKPFENYQTRKITNCKICTSRQNPNKTLQLTSFLRPNYSIQQKKILAFLEGFWCLFILITILGHMIAVEI